jgi:DNA-binding transcriptional LysR family regulator
MNFRLMRYFAAVAEQLSFSKAAAQLSIAQPALSQQIRQLEDQLGVVLFHRNKRHVALSAAGEVYLRHVQEIMRATEVAAMQARRAERGELGSLVVGFFEHMSYTLLPPIIREYRALFPDVDLRVKWFPVVEQIAALQRGEVDVSFFRPVAEPEGVTCHPLLVEPFVLAMPKQHRLAKQKAISLEHCSSDNFIMYNQQLAPDFHRAIHHMCATAGFTPNVALEVAQVYTCLGLVTSGIGIAFVPRSLEQLHHVDAVYRPLRGDNPPVEVSLAWREKAQSPLRQAFVKVANDVVTRLMRRR